MRSLGMRTLMKTSKIVAFGAIATTAVAAEQPTTRPAAVPPPVVSTPPTAPVQPAASVQPVTEVDLLRRENQVLQAQIRNLQQELVHYQSFVTNMGENALRAPFGRLMLIRRPGFAAAIVITEHTRPIEVQVPAGRIRSRKGARYLSWVQKDGTADFSKPNIIRGAAEVFEEEGSDNGNALLNLDGFKIQWSISDWIYFPENAPDLEMAITEYVRIEDVRFDDPSHIWISQTTLQDFARSLRRVLAQPPATGASAS